MPSAFQDSYESPPSFTKPVNSRARDLKVEDLTTYMDVNVDWEWDADGITATEATLSLAKQASSINVPCGVHAGHPQGMQSAVAFAGERGMGLGALIGYPDPANGGWQPMPELTEPEFKAWVWVQLGALTALAHINRAELQHVRPHGALYDAFFAKPDSPEWDRLIQLSEAVVAYNPWLVLIGPFGEALQHLQAKTGVRIAPEVHVGKRYTNGGKPFYKETAKDLPAKAASEQIHQLVKQGTITSQTGATLTPMAKSCHVSAQHTEAEAVVTALTERITRPLPLSLVLSANSGWL